MLCFRFVRGRAFFIPRGSGRKWRDCGRSGGVLRDRLRSRAGFEGWAGDRAVRRCGRADRMRERGSPGRPVLFCRTASPQRRFCSRGMLSGVEETAGRNGKAPLNSRHPFGETEVRSPAAEAVCGGKRRGLQFCREGGTMRANETGKIKRNFLRKKNFITNKNISIKERILISLFKYSSWQIGAGS